MRYRKRIALVAAVSVLVAASMVWGAQGRSVKVTVNYTGSGAVSATNALYLAVWDTPDFAGGALPIGTQVVTENGGSATFSNLDSSSVYVTALFVRGGWDQLSAVPSGSPAGAHSTDGFGTPAAIDLQDGQTAEIALSFDDAFRMP